MSATPKRLAITLVAALLLLAAQSYVPLPGVDVPGLDARLYSVFSLGVTPILTAYWLVEVVAFLVPRWSRLRHVPQGRARLERVARLLALVLAGLQALAIAWQLQALAIDRAPSTWAVVVSLVGGVCVLFVAARFVTRHGLTNGLVLFVCVALVPDIKTSLSHALASHLGGSAFGMVLPFVGLPIVALGSWVVLGRPSAPPLPTRAREEREDGIYRGAQTLVVHPYIPLPAGSIQPIAAAFALLVLPTTLSTFGVPVPGLVELRSDSVYWPFFAITCGVLVWLAARLMNRPRELAGLAKRLGAKANAHDVTVALRAALPTTFLFVVLAVLGGKVTTLYFASIPVLVAFLIDAAHALRIAAKRPSFVPVFEERRASAVPVLRAALAAEGIASEVRGLSFLALFQVFVPYAPAEILVDEADAPRAAKALRHWLTGSEAPAREPTTDKELAFLAQKATWPARTRNAVLAICTALLAALVVVPSVTLTAPPPKERHTLEVVRVDDTIDLFRAVDESTLPKGVEIRYRNEPVGRGQTMKTDFAKITLTNGEPITAGRERLRAYLKTFSSELPPGARFGVEDSSEYDEDTSRSRIVGASSLVLTGEAALRNSDVADAAATVNEDGSAYVGVTLTAEGAKRFEDVTGAWVNRRIAIIVDDVVVSAPVVKSRIGGGHVSITMGAGDPDVQLAQARSLARSLSP